LSSPGRDVTRPSSCRRKTLQRGQKEDRLSLSSSVAAMLDTLTFLLEKLFLLAHIKLSSLPPPLGAEPPLTRRCEREEPAPQAAGAPQRFQRGDLLEVPRTLFTHFGIYLGENRVAHLIPDILPALTADSRQIQEMVTNTRLLLGVLSKRASIRVDSVEDFAYGAGILLNAMDQAVRRSPLSGEEVARRAERLLGSVSYSLLWNNCEHFVTYCRYGAAQSLQTDKTIKAPGDGFTSCLAMFPLQLLALLFISTPRPDGKDGRGPKEEEEDRQTGGRTDRKYDLTLKRGDLLEVPRTMFTHFGIYLGGGRVAHFIPDILPVISRNQSRIKEVVTNSRLLLGVLAKCGSVRVDSVEDFAYGSEILVNTKDQVCSQRVLQAEEVARRAEKLQGHVSYSLLWYNCEHFVMYCRYGTVMSFQTFQFCKTVRKLLLSRRVAKVTAVMGMFLLLQLGTVTSGAALLAVLLPYLIWMAS
ncbi:hypothetical protein L3Q82_016474, partial [Scortum barcoo]